MEPEIKNRFIAENRMFFIKVIALRATTSLGGREGAFVNIFLLTLYPVEYTDPDGRKGEGQLNLNAEAGGASISGKKEADAFNGTLNGKVGGTLEATSFSAYAGIKDTALGAEAGASAFTASGEASVTIMGLEVKVKGEGFAGGAKIGGAVGVTPYSFQLKAKAGAPAGLGIEVRIKLADKNETP